MYFLSNCLILISHAAPLTPLLYSFLLFTAHLYPTYYTVLNYIKVSSTVLYSIRLYTIYSTVLYSNPLFCVMIYPPITNIKQLTTPNTSLVPNHTTHNTHNSEASADIPRSLELAAYFTHCNLQPSHLMLALKTAMALAFKSKVSIHQQKSCPVLSCGYSSSILYCPVLWILLFYSVLSCPVDTPLLFYPVLSCPFLLSLDYFTSVSMGLPTHLLHISPRLYQPRMSTRITASINCILNTSQYSIITIASELHQRCRVLSSFAGTAGHE